ncbi:dTDP-glucose pyrophosphorylase [Pelotomaculum thermopropionicum SI]|uniref:Glucose-1-phosphate thymidylyltransferase n=1 Tax=Pelotomaculum thermopropionicum (strain DSM 13744 / JCM 10971 / SI) TaxID=370438 RepID=A5CZ13_PELTS|nr:dTDP-glucose pyrophosphorylase [Pelotomaculum thermopropionicum SI]
MIYYPIAKLAQAGIKDILIITGREHMGDVVNLLGSGRQMNLDFTYRVQDEAGGIAQALGLAKDFVGEKQCVVILGDNIFEDDITPYVNAFREQGRGARILIKEVPDPKRFGVPELNGSKIVSIEEKPKQPKSKYAVTGIYMYDSQVFNIIKTLKPSWRGELEVTDINNAYIQMDCLYYDVMHGWWSDAGTFKSLAQANEMTRITGIDKQIGEILGEKAVSL